MALPPSLAGAVQDTSAEALPAVAVAPVGAPGAVGPPPPLEMWAAVLASLQLR